jgi:uncharacterized protein (DUF3084 family)
VTDGAVIAVVFGAAGLAINVAVIMWRGGGLAKSIDAVVAAQTAAKIAHDEARAESKAQHEATLAKVTTLSEQRVAADAAAQHLRADFSALQKTVDELRADTRENAKEIVETRHTLRTEWQTAINALTREPPTAKRPPR